MITQCIPRIGAVLALTTNILLSAVSFGEDRTLKLDSLSLQTAVQLALDHHPTVRAADASVRAANAGYRQALSGLFPSLSFTGTGQRTEGAFVFNPSFPPRNQGYNSYTVSLLAQQTIYDFGRTFGRISAGDDLAQASIEDFLAARENVIMNVQLAYFALLQAEQVVVVDEEARDQSARRLVQAKAFYSVGKRPQFDVTKAEVDLANANVNLIRARNQMRVARIQLENAMGVRPAAAFRLADTFEVPAVNITLDSAQAVAVRERPDLLSARGRVSASRSLEKSAFAQHLPVLSAFGSYTWANFEWPLFNRWNAGITLSIPVFQGFSVVAQVQQAEANTDGAQAALETLTENVLLEVEQAHLSLKEAEERITATLKLQEQAEQNMNLAEKQYAAGVGTLLEVSDAQLSRSNARITRIQALHDYNSWLVRLQKAMGLTTHQHILKDSSK